MQRTNVKSSNIASIGYDAEHHVLEIEFHSGGVYEYQGVPKEKHAALMNAPSVGRYFAKEIKGKFECEKVDG